MDEFTLGAIIVLFTAVFPCLIFGYLIAYRSRRHFISGWSDSKVSNPERSGRVIGLSLIVMALFLGVIALFGFFQYISETELVYSLIPISLLPLAAMLYVKIKYGVK